MVVHRNDDKNSKKFSQLIFLYSMKKLVNSKIVERKQQNELARAFLRLREIEISSQPPTNVAYTLVLLRGHILVFLFLFCPPLVEWYLNTSMKVKALPICLVFTS